MKLFNPFTPHVAKYGNAFVIRKFELGFCRWEYLDRESSHWWSDTRITKAISMYCTFPSAEWASDNYSSRNFVKPRVRSTFHETL